MRTRTVAALVLVAAMLAAPAFGAISLSPLGKTGTFSVVVVDNGFFQIVETFRPVRGGLMLVSQTETWYVDADGDGQLSPGEAYHSVTHINDFGR